MRIQKHGADGWLEKAGIYGYNDDGISVIRTCTSLRLRGTLRKLG